MSGFLDRAAADHAQNTLFYDIERVSLVAFLEQEFARVQHNAFRRTADLHYLRERKFFNHLACLANRPKHMGELIAPNDLVGASNRYPGNGLPSALAHDP
jgi:hypothetical protein